MHTSGMYFGEGQEERTRGRVSAKDSRAARRKALKKGPLMRVLFTTIPSTGHWHPDDTHVSILPRLGHGTHSQRWIL